LVLKIAHCRDLEVITDICISRDVSAETCQRFTMACHAWWAYLYFWTVAAV